MGDIRSRIEKNEKDIRELSDKIDKVSKFDELSSEVRDINSAVIRMSLILERHTMKQEKIIKLIYTWVCFSFVLIFASVLMANFGGGWLKILESISSWITCLFLVGGGIYSSYLVFKINKRIGYIVSAGWSLISTCYLGYVLLNFGSLHPEAAAIGFNIGAFAQTVVLLILCKSLSDNGKHG